MTEPYLEPYARHAAAHGTDFRVTLWASESSQQLRFEVFAQMCFLGGKRVLDAGCSRGDFAKWLLDHGVEYDRFIGVDALEPVIAFARERSLPRSQFVVGDLVKDAAVWRTGDPQVICLSGALNTMEDEQARQTLEHAWAAAGETLLFNFLSDRHDRGVRHRQDPARRLNTLELLDWAMARTPLVAFRQDYFTGGHDATIMMRRR